MTNDEELGIGDLDSCPARFEEPRVARIAPLDGTGNLAVPTQKLRDRAANWANEILNSIEEDREASSLSLESNMLWVIAFEIAIRGVEIEERDLEIRELRGRIDHLQADASHALESYRTKIEPTEDRISDEKAAKLRDGSECEIAPNNARATWAKDPSP